MCASLHPCVCHPVLPCVPLCTPVYPCVHVRFAATLCTPMYPYVPLCTPVHPRVPLCTPISVLCTPVCPCVSMCILVYPCVPLCTPGYPYVPLIKRQSIDIIVNLHSLSRPRPRCRPSAPRPVPPAHCIDRHHFTLARHCRPLYLNPDPKFRSIIPKLQTPNPKP